jgi:type IV fimbrial biogenesis protein FimT
MSRGFTLLELMVTIAIMAIVAGLAAPSFVLTIENNRVQTAANNFFLSVIQARNEAVKRNQPVVLCKSANGTSCTSSGDWEQGWIAFVSEDATLDAGEPIFAAYGKLPGEITLRAANGSDDTLSILSDGSTGFAEVFNVCTGSDVERGRSVDISVTGRPARELEATECP